MIEYQLSTYSLSVSLSPFPRQELNVQVEFLSDIAFQPGLPFPVTIFATSADGGPVSGAVDITVNYRTKDSVLLLDEDEQLVYPISLDATGRTTIVLDVPVDNGTCCDPWTLNSPVSTPCPL